jgi:hypothetical protein
MNASLNVKSLGAEAPEAPEPSGTQERRNYLITVGIDKYLHAATLYCSKIDCQKLSGVLIEDYGFEPLTWYSEGSQTETDKPMMLEDATFEEIETLFKHLSKHPRFKRVDSAEPDHNLLIYFSGHGTLQKNFGRDLFHWVPSDYDGLNPSNLLYSITQLVEALGKIRYHHLILISDTCHAGGALPFTELFSPFAEGAGLGNFRDRRSAWGICSSSAEQLSVEINGLSLFTSQLIDKLRNNNPCEFNIVKLCEMLDEAMEKLPQRPQHGRLGFQDNTGKFYFTPSQKKIERDTLAIIRYHLRQSITEGLNFVKEKRRLIGMQTDNHSLVIITSQKDSALKVLIRSVNQEKLFVGYNQMHFYDEQNLDFQGAGSILEKVLVYFRLALEIKSQNQETLIRDLTQRLQRTSLFMGLYLYRKTNQNYDLIKAILAIIQKLPSENLEGRLYFFILDENGTDYSKLETQPSILISNPILLRSGDFKEWYKFQLKQMGVSPDAVPPAAPPANPYIRVLFEERIYSRLSGCKDGPDTGSQPQAGNPLDTGIRPAPAIREICQLAGCPGLAETLLNSFDNLPPNYQS